MTYLLETNQELSEPSDPSMHQRNFSVSDYLKAQNPNNKARPRSLKKTESQGRLKTKQRSSAYEATFQSNWATTTGKFYKPNDCVKLHKTGDKIRLNRTGESFGNRHEESKLVTVFPYLDEYFPTFPQEYRNFKMHCLGQLPNQPFFENELIKVSLQPNEFCSYTLAIHNKTDSEQKIRLLPGSPCVELEGSRTFKTPSHTVFECIVNIVNPDLNLRHPRISVVLGNRGISLTNTAQQEKAFHIYLPITLLDLCHKSGKPLKVTEGKRTLRYESERFRITDKLHSSSVLRNFHSDEQGWSGCISLDQASASVCIPFSTETAIVCSFEDDHTSSSGLVKVLLQLFMHLLR